MVEWDKVSPAEGAGLLGRDGREHCRRQSHQQEGKGSELEKKEGKGKYSSYL